MKKSLLLCFLCYSTMAPLDAQEIEWQKTFKPNPSQQYLYNVYGGITSKSINPQDNKLLAYNNYAHLAQVVPSKLGGYQLVLQDPQKSPGYLVIDKLDVDGNLIMQTAIGKGEFSDIKPTSDGGLLILGRRGPATNDIDCHHGGISDIWVAKTDSLDGIEWQLCVGRDDMETPGRIEASGEDTWLLNGWFHENLARPDLDYYQWVAKVSIDGSLIWEYRNSLTKRIKASTYYYRNIIHASETDDNKIHFFGAGLVEEISRDYAKPISRNNASIMLLDRNTNTTNDISLSLSDIGISDIVKAKDGNFYIVGNTYCDFKGCTQYDSYIIKMNKDGTILWRKKIGGNGSLDFILDAEATPDGGCVLLGATNSTEGDFKANNGETLGAWVLKFAADGNMDWQKIIPAEENIWNLPSHIAYCPDGGYVFNGIQVEGNNTSNFSTGGEYNIWVVKLGKNGQGKDNNIIEVKAFPNPFIGNQLNIQYVISKGSAIEIRLYDVQGNILLTQKLPKKKMGTYTESITVGDLPSGVYFVRVVSEQGSKTAEVVKVQ